MTKSVFTTLRDNERNESSIVGVGKYSRKIMTHEYASAEREFALASFITNGSTYYEVLYSVLGENK